MTLLERMALLAESRKIQIRCSGMDFDTYMAITDGVVFGVGHGDPPWSLVRASLHDAVLSDIGVSGEPWAR